MFTELANQQMDQISIFGNYSIGRQITHNGEFDLANWIGNQ
jgi:hypothetical protein